MAGGTRIKPGLYAAAGVPDYWVIDLVAKRVRVFREPGDGGYAAETVLGPSGLLEPVAIDVPPLDLAALFRGLQRPAAPGRRRTAAG